VCQAFSFHDIKYRSDCHPRRYRVLTRVR
jgi:hypothetical protein